MRKRKHTLILSKIVLLLYTILLISSSGLSATLADFFPLRDGSTYTYLGNGGRIDRNGVDVERVVVRSYPHSDGSAVYCWTDGNASIITTMLGLGCFLMDNMGLWTMNAEEPNDLKFIGNQKKHLLIGVELIPGSSFSFDDDDANPKRTLFVEGFEDVCVAAGAFQQCLKLRIQTKWPKGTEENAFVWLAEHIGMVKLHRSTNKVSELIDYQIADGASGAWDAREKIVRIAQREGINQVEEIVYSASHPISGGNVYFRVYGDEKVSEGKGRVKRVRGRLNVSNQQIQFDEQSVERFLLMVIQGSLRKIQVNSDDLDEARKAIETFYSLPQDHTDNGCGRVPDDFVPSAISYDKKADVYALHSARGNYVYTVRFKIAVDKILIMGDEQCFF